MKSPRILLAMLAALALLVAACDAEDIGDPLEDDTPEDEVTPDEIVTPDDEDVVTEDEEEDVVTEDEEEDVVADDAAVATAPGLESDEDATLVELLSDHGEFSEFVAALEDAGVDTRLEGPGPFTVFAPTDEAFDIVPEHQREEAGEDLELLENILLSHVHDGELTVDELSDGDTIEMLDGTEREVLVTDEGQIFVGAAQVIESDVRAANGAIHAIDFVLFPAPPDEEVEEDADDEDEDETDDEDDEATDDEDEDNEDG